MNAPILDSHRATTYLAERHLAEVFKQIEANDINYDVRQVLIFRALGFAASVGFDCGIRMDPLQQSWPVIYIELPTGQVSWHMAPHKRGWDGHSTDEKYRRIDEYRTKVQNS